MIKNLGEERAPPPNLELQSSGAPLSFDMILVSTPDISSVYYVIKSYATASDGYKQIN
jgi:hypothetical protein